MTGDRPRRRPGWIVAIGVIALTVAAPGYPVSAQWALTRLWSDVTPGRVTVAPWAVGSGDDAAIAVVTEDRWIRVRDARGMVVDSARTGLREPVGVLREGPHHSLLIPPRDGGSFVRVDHYGKAVQVVGQPIAVDTVLPGNTRFVVTDGESLMYSVSADGSITHASATGGVLWERRLPAPATTTVTYRGAVYVALEDGRLFRFDGNGTGVELLRLSAPVIAMKGLETPSPTLLTVDGDGVLSRIDFAGGESNEVSIQWQIQALASDTAALRAAPPHLEVIPPRGRTDSWHAVVGRPDGGVTVVNSDGSKQEDHLLQHVPIDAVLTGRLPSGGFLVWSDRYVRLVSSTGTLLDEAELQKPPATATWIDSVGQLILTYPDWTIEAWTVTGALYESSPAEEEWPRSARQERRQVNAFPPGALTARAEAVFAGTSRTERMELLSEIQSQRRRAVLFDRVAEARAILRRLVRETLEAPDVQDGRVRNDFPDVRRAAVEEMGLYMDRTCREVLTEVARYDPDARVVATALQAIARYGVDEAGAVAYAVERFRRANDWGRSVLAPALIDLLELTSTGHRHPAAGQEALVLLIESNLSRDIRRRAATIQRGRYR